MNQDLKIKVQTAINKSLDQAEDVWNEVKEDMLIEKAMNYSEGLRGLAREVPTQIPGFPKITEGKPEVANFIAMTVDIRNSTKHLLNRITQGGAKASELERVLYETSALTAAGSVIVENNGGGITEFLGDGFLAFFKVEDEKNPDEVYEAHRTALYLTGSGLAIINEILNERYNLPQLIVGVGMAYSKAIVTIAGYGNNIQPKALGECVYRSTKLSKGYNDIIIDAKLNYLWPSEENGTLKIGQPSFYDEVKGYKLL